MNEDEYLTNRLDDQIEWHDRKSAWNQRWHKRVQVITIATAALVPFAAVLDVAPPWVYKVVVGLLGVAAALAAGVSGIYRFQELWIDYRLTAESLRAEKYRFQTRVAPYDGQDAFATLVENVEGILSQQNQRWRDRHGKRDKSPPAVAEA